MDHYIFVEQRARRNYGCFALLLDLICIGLTSGLWIIWIIIRQFRNRGR